MRGYLSFVLVLVSIVLVLSLLEFSIKEESTKALLTERSYSLSMNVKEAVIESIRYGAHEGYSQYDLEHDILMCKHCPVCLPAFCNPILCQQCFYESEARRHAKAAALARLEILKKCHFDQDFTISIGTADLEVHSTPDALSKNGFALDSIKLNNDVTIMLFSEKFNITGQSKLPGGMIINAGD